MTTQILKQACYHSTGFMPMLTVSEVPPHPLSQTTFHTAMSLNRVTPAVGRGLLFIFVSQTVLAHCHHELIRDTVSAMHVSLSRISSSRDKDRQKHSQMIMTFVQMRDGMQHERV